jgi:glycolate oxidase iron-sulfur subunit
MPHLYGPVHEATLRVLRHNGCEVYVPRDQVAAAPQRPRGERDVTRDLAGQNARAFLGLGLDAIVVNSAAAARP